MKIVTQPYCDFLLYSSMSKFVCKFLIQKKCTFNTWIFFLSKYVVYYYVNIMEKIKTEKFLRFCHWFFERFCNCRFPIEASIGIYIEKNFWSKKKIFFIFKKYRFWRFWKTKNYFSVIITWKLTLKLNSIHNSWFFQKITNFFLIENLKFQFNFTNVNCC